MGQKDLILNVFYNNPTKSFQIREVSRVTKVPKTTTHSIINSLIKEGMIVKEKKHVFPSFKANNKNPIFKFEKKNFALRKILKSDLIWFLADRLLPKCIIIFGSIAKGEFDKTSDIDIFIQSKDRKIDLSNYEKKLKREINLFIEEDINKLSNELFNNIINGIKVYGFLKLK